VLSRMRKQVFKSYQFWLTLVDANFLKFLSGTEDFGDRSSPASFLNL